MSVYVISSYVDISKHFPTKKICCEILFYIIWYLHTNFAETIPSKSAEVLVLWL